MKELPEIDGFTVQHLPIISSYARKIGIIDIINTLVPTEMGIDAGTVILGMVLDTLTGRSPLYRLNTFFKNQDTELLLGKKTDPRKFSDYTVGRVLDRIYEYGAMKVFSEISLRALDYFNIDRSHVSFDTTSVTVQGDYPLYSKDADNSKTMTITYGHSKDHRPDLKQFLVKMLCVDRTIPVFGQTEDGNASDKTINNEVLSSISKYMAENGIKKEGFIYIADSAMVTRKNMEKIGDEIRFISRLPATYKECSRLIQKSIVEDNWTDLGKLSDTTETQNRPAAVYKACESEAILYGRSYRAVVVHSSAHDKRRQNRIDRELKNEHTELSKRIKILSKQEFFCHADAEKAAIEMSEAKHVFYKPVTQVVEIPKYKRGRPKKDGSRALDKMMYSISCELAETEAVENLKKETGCFVLLCNVDRDGQKGYSSYDILRTYKDQYGIEQNFGFIKNTPIVNSIFLKKAERIEVLALVLLLSLLIWRLIEYNMRRYAKKENKDLPGWNKRRTFKPTSFMLMISFQYLMILKIGNHRRLNRPLSTKQLEYLKALGLKSQIFTTPGG
ncbi:transposase family protein [Desulforapulum autotrophicum HRM2]|uniref:Transposase (IS4 family protein) n=1 Tax=Desulforapulum autotrophicum (strain ATCC 43914 / DSM 3382 / VKM B-1955 / HRM2) TaxID=177437 RepID=C0QB33_DESAH|nr:IS1634 family transposase [Desulforapulum autotrophicum]ACN14832.1 transposase (IS4 family protein) [Desulforapulum autotrophicum HRM2]ACN16469.1 transposase family protein [Desulforapulum autotrophicum HRM2]